MTHAPRAAPGGNGSPDGPRGGGSERREALRSASLWAKAAFFVYPPVVASGFILGLSAANAFLLAALIAFLPLLAVAQVPVVAAGLAAGEPLDRGSAYVSSAVTMLLLGGVAVTAGRQEPGIGALGLVFPPAADAALWAISLIVLSLTLMGLFHGLGRLLGVGESALLWALLPRTTTERRLFVLLSLAAGLGEEVAFRGYVLAVLAGLGLGPWGAAAAAAVPFGFLHAYQGWWGIVRTAFVGLILGASVVLSGSIWPAALAHAAVDVIAGLWLGPWLLSRR